MKTRFFFSLIIATLPILPSIAVEGEVKEVVVYRNGAKITTEAAFSLSAGKQDVVISNLTSTIDANSLQVKVFGSATLLSATVRTNFMGYESLPQRTRQIKDSLQMVKDNIDWLNHKQTINQNEEKLLMENQKIVNEKTVVTAAEIGQLADMYKKRMLTLHKERFDTQLEIRELSALKTRLEKQLNELQHQQGKRMGEVVLTIHAKQAGKARAEIAYLSHNAGWNPIYDLRCEGVGEAIDLLYKANVYQTTGFDWDDVSLSVSTGNPTANNDRPVLHPWFIDFQSKNYGYGANQKSARTMAPASNMYMAEAAVAEDKMELQAPVPFEVSEIAGQMATEYKIEIAQTIPSDGREHMVPVQEYELPASYTYHAVPKLNQRAFLLAKVGGYNQYSLLPGETNIFFEGTYVGTSYLNPEATSDSLIVSMGRDERINIERNILKDFTAERTIGTNQKVTKGYELVIRNNKAIPIDIEVLDQVPLSQNKDIEVEIEEMSGADFSSAYGRVMWDLTLKPGEVRKLRFVYSVKYPKDQTVPGI